MQAKANGEGERKREEKRGEWERVMGTERLCKTKEREREAEDEEEDSKARVGSRRGKERQGCAEIC